MDSRLDKTTGVRLYAGQRVRVQVNRGASSGMIATWIPTMVSITGEIRISTP
jgi:hypothetical protein